MMKKIIMLLSATVVLISCSKVKKGEFLITGTAKGIANGKTIVLETQSPDGGSLVAFDTVKVENEKFEIKGKFTELSFHLLQLEAEKGKEPFAKVAFIMDDEGEIKIEINKDSIAKSKVSGTYNNDEYVKFNEELVKIQKKLMDFQSKNMALMNKAQQTNDTVVINKLMTEFRKVQESVGTDSKKKYLSYVETHPKSFITVLILQGMLNDPTVDAKKTETIYNGLEESLKNTKPGKAIKDKLKQIKTPSVGAAPAPAAPAVAK
jgi:hypothetical protein